MGQIKTFKLKEMFRTRFLYITFKVDMNYVLLKCREIAANPELTPHAGGEVIAEVFQAVRDGYTPEFDLADCHISSDFAALIFTEQDKGALFCDSVDKHRDEILKENRKRCENYKLPTQELPTFKLNCQIIDYINSLRNGILYTYPASGDTELYRALIIMIAILRPKVQIAMDNMLAKILLTVNNSLSFETISQYDEFYFFNKEGVDILKSENGMVHTQRLGLISLEDAMHNGFIVPTAFGREKLYKVEGWDLVFKRALNTVNKLKSQRSRTLREVLVED